MTATRESDGGGEVERLCTVIGQRLGLAIEGAKLGDLSELLARRAQATRLTAAQYVDSVERGGTDELSRLANELLVNETYFFRHGDQLRAFVEVAWPRCVSSAAARGRPVSILSAGCASGDEAYTIAILARRATPAAEPNVLGVDLSPSMIAKARAGRYSAWALRDTPDDVRRRWFRSANGEHELVAEARVGVRFEPRNLSMEHPDIFRFDALDAVFCRNLLMYLTPAAARGLVERIAYALVPGGSLFLGPAESLRGISDDFELRQSHGAFHYERRGDRCGISMRGIARPAPQASNDSTVVAPPHVPPATAPSSTGSLRLVDAHRGDPRGPIARDDADREKILELLRVEQFADALALLDRESPIGPSRDPETLLLRAALRAQTGDLAGAELVCDELLAIDRLNAGAHRVLALCREGRGDRASANEHDRIAAHLDPSFAMPRLALGIRAKRDGDHAKARLELTQALTLLEREDAMRVLMFGGGFGRVALIQMCRAELLGAADGQR